MVTLEVDKLKEVLVLDVKKKSHCMPPFLPPKREAKHYQSLRSRGTFGPGCGRESFKNFFFLFPRKSWGIRVVGP